MDVDSNTRPIVTIVTPCYNNEKYIYDAIDSVLKQTYPNIEYIVTDDGSKDFRYDEIKRYIECNKRSNIISFKIIKHKKNIGIVKNINNAYSQAKGEILMPLSADDVFLNKFVVEKIINRMIEKQCKVLLGIRIVSDDNLKPIRRAPYSKYIKKVKKLDTSYKQYKSFLVNNFYNVGSGSAMYVRKDYLKKVGYFDEGYYLLEDKPFLTQYCQSGNMIDIAYDIDSILYRDVGVSSKKGRHNELIKKDYIRYYKKYVDTKSCSNLRFYEYRNIDYIRSRNEVSKIIDIFFLKIKFFDVSIMDIFKRLIEKYYLFKDAKTIKDSYITKI